MPAARRFAFPVQDYPAHGNRDPIPKNFELHHQLRNRVRIVSSVLAGDPERGYILEILLKKRPEIKRVRSVIAIGSVAIEFDSARLPKKPADHAGRRVGQYRPEADRY